MDPAEFRAIRKDLGLTQTELAAVMGYSSQPVISAIENGGSVPALPERLIRAYEDGYRPDDWPG